ncbi:MAG: OmpH family outer membrane protein [Kiritimatiellae bacterium]|nr:OmpH family outer membrane protein [Kiritimatiellia bacterium]
MKLMGFVLMSVLAAATAGFAQEKTVVVNMVDLVRFHPSRERDRKLMQDTEKDYQAKLDKQRDRFEQLRADYENAVKEARNPALNEAARQEAETKMMKHRDVLAEADKDLRAEMQKLQRELSELDNRLLRQVTGDIREVVHKYAAEKKLSMVMDSTTLAYFDPAMDVTDEILKRMNVDPKVRHEAKAKDKEKAAAEDADKK